MRRSISLLSFVFVLFFVFEIIILGCSKPETIAPIEQPPIISNFSPSSGVAGDQIIISGNNFGTIASRVVVKFNGTSAIVNSVSNTQLTVTVPSGSLSGKITVTIGGQSATSTSDFTVVVPVAVINSFSPTNGISGDTLFINGNNFGTLATAVTVKFNGTTATVINVTNTQLTVIVPSGVTAGKITVSINSQTATSAIDFTVVGTVSTLAGNGIAGFADGTGINAMFNHITDLVLDAAGNMFVTDGGNFRIRKITPAGVVSTLAGSGNNGFIDGNGSNASFGTMLGIAIDVSGNLYVADLGNSSIRKITPAGTVSTIAGGPFPGYVDGTAATAKFNLPMGVVVDNTGNIYVADAGNNVIRKISITGIVSTVAGNGIKGFADGASNTARFNNPMKIKLDPTGNLIVLDQFNNRVRKISSTGVVSTVAGNGIAGFADGNAGTAEFNDPAGLCLDGAGNIYISDQLNQRIRKISTTGNVSTVAGVGIMGYRDGAVTVAQFFFPNGLDITSNGVIYVTDNQNQRIRKITP